MLTSSNASRRLGLTAKAIDSIFEKNGISDKALFGEFTETDLESLMNYINVYVVKISLKTLKKLISEHLTIKELILAIACLSGDGKNIEVIWIVFKIVIYKI